MLTAELTLRHVSVASGGYEAVVACATKLGFEIIRNEGGAPLVAPGSSPSSRRSGGFTPTSQDAAGYPAGGPPDARWGEKFATAWSTLRKATAAAGGAAGGSEKPSWWRPGGAADAASPAASAESASAATAAAAPLGPPSASRDRPGSWPAGADLEALPRRPREDVRLPGLHWPCTAVSVRWPPATLAAAGAAADAAAPSLDAMVWEGCPSILAVAGGRLLCVDARDSGHARVFAEHDIGRVLKVTSKKGAPEVLIFYFRGEPEPADAPPADEPPADAPPAVRPAAAADPALVLYFANGPEDVKSFIRVLRGSYQTG